MKHNVQPNTGGNKEVLEFHEGINSTKLYKEFLSMKPSSWKKYRNIRKDKLFWINNKKNEIKT